MIGIDPFISSDVHFTQSDRSTAAGVLYVVAFEKHYLREAVLSARSARLFCERLPLAICTNLVGEAEECGVFDKVIPLDLNDEILLKAKERMTVFDDVTLHIVKIVGLRNTPFKRTLFLDSDTLVTRDIRELFCSDHSDFSVAEEGYYRQSVREKKVWNTGLILYEMNPQIWEFLDVWHRIFYANRYSEPEMGDQHYFNFLSGKLFQHLNIRELDCEQFNVRPPVFQTLDSLLVEKCAVLHMHGLCDPHSEHNKSVLEKMRTIPRLCELVQLLDSVAKIDIA